MSMFCFQCQEAAKGVSYYADLAQGHDLKIPDADRYVFDAMFVTITNANFDDVKIIEGTFNYGIKGMAAYAEHAYNLGYQNENVFAFMHRGLAATTRTDISADELITLNLECGKYGVDVMALLDKANTESYGNPEITSVNIGVKGNPAILISGHDLKDMELLLQQTEGRIEVI